MGLFRNNNYNSGHASYSKTIASAANRKERYFGGKKEDVMRGYFKGWSIGEKQEFRVMMIFHWLSCWGG